MLINFKFIKGRGTISSIEYPKIEANPNYIGISVIIPISQLKNIIFKNEESFIYYLKLMFIRQKSDIK